MTFCLIHFSPLGLCFKGLKKKSEILTERSRFIIYGKNISFSKK